MGGRKFLYPKPARFVHPFFDRTPTCDRQTDTGPWLVPAVAQRRAGKKRQHTHTHTFNGPFPRLPGWAGTRKVKPIWILLKQETVSGSGISWAMYKSAPHYRQITTPAPHNSVFTGRVPFLPPNQQRQSTEATAMVYIVMADVCCSGGGRRTMSFYWICMGDPAVQPVLQPLVSYSTNSVT